MKSLLVVVDYQTDFVSGALGFDGAEKLEPGIAAAVSTTLQKGGYVLFTMDTHAEDYLFTREGKHIPVPHCIKDTPGHMLHGALHQYQVSHHPHTMLFNKPTFGGNGIAPAAQKLCGGPPEKICLCGIVTDICVISNAILLHSAFLNADIHIIESLVGSGNPQNAAAALTILRGLGISVSG